MRVFAMLSLGTVAQRKISTELGLKGVSYEGMGSEGWNCTHYDIVEKPYKVVKQKMRSCQSRRRYQGAGRSEVEVQVA